jgi:hypothetical protein
MQPIESQTIDMDTVSIKKVTISEKSIQKYKDDSAFNYEPIQQNDNFISRLIEKIINGFSYILEKLFSWLFGVKTGGKIVRFLIKALPYIAIIIFVYLIFKFLLGIDLIRLKQQNQRYTTQVYLSEDEKIIKEEDLDQLIRKAKNNKDYRLAVRYQYLKILKWLIDNELIAWHPDKTNRDYVREIKEKKLQSGFNNLTFIYDYVWYGNFFPNDNEYKEIEGYFDKLINLKNLNSASL